MLIFVKLSQGDMNFKRLFFFLSAVIAFSSCTLNKEFMFKTDEDYVFDVPVIDSSSIDYKIQTNDVISFDLFTNDGAIMLEYTTSSVEAPRYAVGNSFQFTVNAQGFVEFPVIGMKEIVGMTIAEAQDFLEAEFDSQFNDPYVIVKVLNRRAIVFTAPAGSGSVIVLQNQGISIIEAIAMAGGLGKNGRADDIKVIRKVGKEQEVYHIDLSKIDGIKYANMSVEAGDIIYVQQTRQLGKEITTDIQPYVAIISAFSLAASFFAVFF